ncbi:hypothetical protein [Pelomonas sp. KK5]|uniref:hypothetical protein n=1 Tax=Pelomonas sp. KK5 TaxID=1855730 RepID=UPI0009FA27C1|nr:hypothetical protein [Pelomonas sp. KK5]
MNAELLLGTHLTVVVRARVAGQAAEIGLVVARQHCVGDQPRRRALTEAAERCAGRSRVAAGRILARIDGRWQTLQAMPSTLKGSNVMNTLNTARSAAAALSAGLLAMAAGTAMAGTPLENYKQERANCLSGNTSQDRATCLREAGAALQEARRNGLTTPTPEQRAQNAVQRCQAQPKEDREDCQRLAMGAGSREGSVSEGATVSQLTTIKN